MVLWLVKVETMGCAGHSETGVKVQLGGGIRTMQTIEKWLSIGIKPCRFGNGGFEGP